MFGKTSLIFFLILFFSNFLENFASKKPVPASACELILSKNASCSTRFPTIINAEEAQLIHTFSPIINVNQLLPVTKMINTGYALTLQGNPPHTNTRVFGGVLCNQKYIFHTVEFYQTSNLTGRSYNVMNEETSPLTVQQTYFNLKYGTFENARKHPDGLVIEVLPIKFSLTDNPLFYPVQLIIKIFLRKPGSFFYLPAIVAFAWYGMQFPTLFEYYVAKGCNLDLATGKYSEPAIMLMAPRSSFALSKSQYEDSFLQLLNLKGQTINNAPPLNPFKGPLYKGIGFLNLWTL